MSETLARLVERTRALLEDLEAARPDVLSITELNRAMKQLLRNQVAILEAVSGAPLTQTTHTTRPQALAAPEPAPAPVAPVVVVRPHAPGGNGALEPASRPEPAGARAASEADVLAPAAVEAARGDAASLAEQVLNEARVVPVHLARSLVEDFDNRDKSYDKGLDKLNRWVAGGAGTPFQWRGDRAYLNLGSGGPSALKNYEEQLMARMGFSRRLGRLIVPALQGEVMVYERPGWDSDINMVKVSEQQPVMEKPTPDIVRKYVWARYIDNEKPKVVVDEDLALKMFEDHYSKHPLNQDDECFYYGILLYERASVLDEANPTRARYLVKAKEVFEVYRVVSGETTWDAIEDRYADVCSFIDTEGLLEKVQSASAALPKVEGMVLVPAGPFPFGPDAKHTHLEPYYIDIYPVTNVEYRRFLEETKYRKPELWARWPELAQDELPVTGVSWMDALQFCKWAKKSLPTAEQWEKAARGTGSFLYPWGNDPPTPDKANYLIEGIEPRLHPARRYEKWKSPYGCVAMVGSVWEWTNTSYIDEEGAQFIMGGSYVDPPLPEYVSVWASQWANKKEKNELIGFRCTKTLEMS